jgi:hypothetical protein
MKNGPVKSTLSIPPSGGPLRRRRSEVGTRASEIFEEIVFEEIVDFDFSFWS